MSDSQRSTEQVLSEKGMLFCTTSGVSMYPMLRDRRDAVVILPLTTAPRKYDVVLYRSGEHQMLHRVVRVTEDGYFVRGDNCEDGEAVTDAQLIGILGEFYRGDRHIATNNAWYRLYSRLAVFFHPLLRVGKKR